MVIRPAWHKILIGCELEEIRFHSSEIGYFKKLLEQRRNIENEEIRQRIIFFINYSDIEIRNANDRLEKYRHELETFQSLSPLD